jgi:phosphopantothenoylcysteine decarboxylase/phosphopantothenate--cysteine ligase
MLGGKRILLGVTGSVAAYKAVQLASDLVKAGALVDVILTRAALEFVTPLSFRAITHRDVFTSMFDPAQPEALEHVTLAREIDAVVVAPATAHALAKFALGLADDLLSATVLATRAPAVIAPAMETAMYEHPATQAHLATLKGRGWVVVGPAAGRLASGAVGMGRLADLADIVGALRWALGRRGDLAGFRIVVTAGPTREPIDPVRVVTNRSSGKMGFAVAEAARDRGAEVVLVTGPVGLRDPYGVEVRRVQTAREMYEAVGDAVKGAHALIAAAAVADYRPGSVSAEKIKKADQPELVVRLVRNPDILGEVRGDFVRVGFAAESQDLIPNARRKLAEKALDLVVANDITAPDAGFEVDTNRVVLVYPDGRAEELPLLSKYEVAHRVLDRVAELLRARRPAGAG